MAETELATSDVLLERVRERYAAAATTVTSGHGSASCCDESGGCCGPTLVEVDDTFGSVLYSAGDRDSLPIAAVAASLGCGNPTAVAELREGETVLDLGSGGGIEAFAQGDPDQMHGLKQTYAAGKSRGEQQDHRTIAQVRKTACPTCALPPGGRNIIRVARAEPAEGKSHRQQQDTAGQSGGAPIEPLDQEVKQRGKEHRAQRRGRLYDTNSEPSSIGFVVLGDQERDDHESGRSLRQPDQNPVRERQLPQVLRKAHTEKTSGHQKNPGKNDPAGAQIVGQFTKEDTADSPAEHAEHVRHRGNGPRPAEFRLNGS